MSSFLFGQFSNTSRQAPPPSNERVVDAQTLAQARTLVEDGNSGLNTEQKQAILSSLEKAEDPVSSRKSPTKMDSLLESLLGIIPLEGLAVWVIATEAFSKLTPVQATDGDAAATITISDPHALKVAIFAAMIVSVISFFLGRRDGDKKNDSMKGSLWVAVIPPAAVFLWAYVVNPSILRTALGRPEPDARWIAAVAAGFVVIILAGFAGLSKDNLAETQNPGQPAPAV